MLWLSRFSFFYFEGSCFCLPVWFWVNISNLLQLSDPPPDVTAGRRPHSHHITACWTTCCQHLYSMWHHHHHQQQQHMLAASRSRDFYDSRSEPCVSGTQEKLDAHNSAAEDEINEQGEMTHSVNHHRTKLILNTNGWLYWVKGHLEELGLVVPGTKRPIDL